MKLGKITEEDLRTIWANEERDFTPWLAKNIEYINDIIDLTLVDVQTEVYVGPYQCDIVARDEISGGTVIIENQLEKTDHNHLGQIITYASGLDAKVMVWVVKEATEQHRAAVEWLNNNLNSGIGFYLVEVHVLKIGDSLPAPSFDIVEGPNDFTNSVKPKKLEGETNKSQSERYEFWQTFNEILKQKGKPFNERKATTDHWYDVAMGTSKCWVTITLVNKEGNIGVGINIPEDKTIYDLFESKKDEIEAACGFSFIWDKLSGKKSSKIVHYINGLNFDDHSNYPELIGETIDKAVKVRDVFKKVYKNSFKEQ